MSPKEKGAPAVATQVSPDLKLCNVDTIEPSHSAQAKTRLKYLAQRLHALGPKPLFHLLDEVERGAPLRAHLEEYARLPVDLIRTFNGDEFVAPFVIEGDDR